MNIDLSIRQLQTNLPWTARYSRDFRSNPQPHKNFAHALHRLGKAAGQLHALVDVMDHDQHTACDIDREYYGRRIAIVPTLVVRIMLQGKRGAR